MTIYNTKAASRLMVQAGLVTAGGALTVAIEACGSDETASNASGPGGVSTVASGGSGGSQTSSLEPNTATPTTGGATTAGGSAAQPDSMVATGGTAGSGGEAVGGTNAAGGNAGDAGMGGAPADETAEPFTIGFIGDFNPDKLTTAMRIARDKGTESMVLSGDFYGGNPTWPEIYQEQMPNRAIFGVIGNHDDDEDAAGLQAQMDASGEVTDQEGELFHDAGYVYKEQLAIVTTEGGVFGNTPDVQFVDDYFSAHADVPWKLCSSHAQQDDLATNKGNATGWAWPVKCMEHGAFWVHGHDHNYLRTVQLTVNPGVTEGDLKDVFALGPADPITVKPGQSFSMLNGMGTGIRSYGGGRYDEWMAGVVANDARRNNMGPIEPNGYGGTGVFVITFNADEDPKKAKAAFYIDEPSEDNPTLTDEFTIIRE